MNEIDLVQLVLRRKLAAVCPRVRNDPVVIAVHELACCSGKRRQSGRHRSGELRKIRNGQRGLIGRRILVADRHKIINDILADLDGIHGGVLRQLGQPIRIIPTDARLSFLRRDQIIRIGLGCYGRLDRCHEASVKADEIKTTPGLIQRIAELVERHCALCAIQLIVTIARERAAAMIPHDERIPIRRERFLTVPDEIRECRGVGHGALADVFVKPLQPIACDLIALVRGIADHAVHPFFAAARFHDQIDLIGDLGLQHLVQVVCRHAVIGLEIRAAHVDHNRKHVSAAAAHGRITFARLS